MKFLIHGSIAYDLLLQYDGSFTDGLDPKKLDHLSVSYLMSHLKRHHGGTATNIAWNIALLGGEPVVVGDVGNDGAEYLTHLQKHGIDTGNIVTHAEHVTATAVIGTDTSERQIAFFHPGADSYGTIPTITTDIAYAIISPRDKALMLKAAKTCAASKIGYLFDPGQQSHAFSRDEFRTVIDESSGMIVNEYEWELASEKLDWDEKDVVEACGLLIITLGEHGARIINRTGEKNIAACKAEKFINPTGAGDALRAGLLIGLGSKWDIEQSVQLGAGLASFVVETEGTQLQNFDRKALDARLKKTYGKN